MVDALPSDRERILNILVRSFDDNLSVNHLVKQDGKRVDRIRMLMEYAYDECSDFGRVLISNDHTSCALLIFPDKKRFTLRSFWRNLKLVLGVMGLGNLPKVLKKENTIKTVQKAIAGNRPVCYLWFIGVHPNYQGRGAGTKLLSEILADCKKDGRICLLETSNEKNLPFYQRSGLELYQTVDVGYPLYFFKMDHQ